MGDPARMQLRNTKEHVPQHPLHSRDRNESDLPGIQGILNAGDKQFSHKTKMLIIFIETWVDELS